MYKKFLVIIILLLSFSKAQAETFIPAQPTMSTKQLRPEMSGYMLTVIKGTEPIRIPIKIVSVVPQKPKTNISDVILIKILGKYKVAHGMSGSPVYVNGKLIGAVAIGWEFGDHSLCCVTPIEDMCKIFDDSSSVKTASQKNLALSNIIFSGIRINNNQSLENMAKRLGVNLVQGISGGPTGNIQTSSLRPGDAVTALLIWGDVEAGASGTVTATDRNGRFLAFGHDFTQKGSVAYPAAKSYVHQIIDSLAFPQRLSTSMGINGMFVQDRAAGLGGVLGQYPQSIAAEFNFKDLDNNIERNYKFRVIADEFLSQELIQGLYAGLLEEAWGRKGQGSISVNLRLDGKNLPKGWARKDVYYSTDNVVVKEAFEDVSKIINAYLTQPFSETLPAGFKLTIEASQSPKILFIEDVKTVSRASPGQEVNVEVTLRSWRKEPVKRVFKLKVPEGASGTAELIVRGGSVNSMGQPGLEGGYKSINSLERMLREISAIDGNNQLFLELNVDQSGNELARALNKRKGSKHDEEDYSNDYLDEEQEFLSDTKERRMNEGNLKIYNSEHYIDGLQRRLIHIVGK